MPKSDQKKFLLHVEETTSRDVTLHDQTSESIRRRLLNLPQQPSFSSMKKSVNKTNSDGRTHGNNPLQNKQESDATKREKRDKNHERNRQSKPDLNKNSNQNNDSKNNPLKNKIKEATKQQIKKQGKRLSKNVISRGSKKLKEKGVKAATKAAAKAVARLAKKFIVKAIALLGKAIGALIASIGLPAILVAAAIAILIVVLSTLSTISMGTGQSVDFLGEEAKELRAYIVELCDKSIDPNKPEQVPYRLPEELLAAVVQLDSWLEKNDGKEPDVEKMKKLLYKFYEALKPSFETEEFTEWTKTRTRSCEEVEKDKDGKETGKCLKYSEWKETVEKRTVRRLTKIVAWNGTATFTYQEEESEWSSGQTSQTKTMAYVIKDQNFEYDFTKLDEVLTANGFGEQDKKMFEYFYESATGVPMHYIDWLNGMAIDFGGMGPDFCFNGTVIPGEGVPPQYMPIYLSAQQKYGIPWYTLAAIHFIETTFSTNVNVSSKGAIGHTQFMPLTWIGWSYPGGNKYGNANIPREILTDPKMIKKYGGYGTDANGDGKADPWDLMDAIHSTAKYLKASGYLQNPRKAIRAYNHSEKYVNDVMSAAERFKNEATLKPTEAKTSETSETSTTSTDSLLSGGPCGGGGEIPPVSSGDFTRPAMGAITSGFGKRDSGMHYGIDIAKPGTVPVVAAADGVVSRSYLSTTYGNCIMIVHNINGVQYETVYAHLRNRAVSEGKTVKKGEFLGYMGNTGRSTGQHLHFEVHKGRWNISKSNAINPLLVIPAK
jgi:murein DD-endopeptidase MepM/ murein hydrolase activator NlpD